MGIDNTITLSDNELERLTVGGLTIADFDEGDEIPNDVCLIDLKKKPRGTAQRNRIYSAGGRLAAEYKVTKLND